MPNDFARCVAQHPDGRWLYHLPPAGRYGTLSTLADGQPMDRIGETNWWAADHEATRITVLSKAGMKATGYELKDPLAASVKFPAELTVEQWQERIDLNDGLVPEGLWDMYNGVYVDQPPTETHIDGPFTILEGGEPPAPGAPQWTVNLVDGITQRPEYQHLFPGYIDGLSRHVHALIQKMPRVRYNFDGRQGKPSGLYVTLALPFETPVTQWRTDTSLRTGKPIKNTGRNVQVTVDRELYLPVPTRVTGDNYAQALAAWEVQVAFWTGIVAQASLAACNHCQGTGHVMDGSAEHEQKR